MFGDLWLLWVAILCFGAIGVIRLCQKRAETKRTQQRNAAEAQKKAKAEAARTFQLGLTELTPDTRIDCLGETYAIVGRGTVVCPPGQSSYVRYLLNDRKTDKIMWLTVLVTSELTYHCLSLWHEVSFEGPYPTIEEQEHVSVDGHVFCPSGSGTCLHLHYPLRAAQGELTGIYVDRWQYIHCGEDCECGGTDEADQLSLDRLSDGQWIANVGRNLKLADVVVLDA